MSDKELVKEISAVEEAAEEIVPEPDINSMLLNFDETSGEGEISPEKLAELARKAPEPNANGNEFIKILSHKLINKNGIMETGKNGAAIDVKNIAGSNIGKATFQTVFYNSKGDIIDTVEQVANDLVREKVRTLRIFPNLPESVVVGSYDISVKDIILTPEQTVTGDDRIKILKHSFHEINETVDHWISQLESTVNVAVKNISDKTVSTAIFEALFYDSEGNVINSVKHKEYDIKPNCSRSFVITIECDKTKDDYARSYNVAVVKTVTTDVEKVQIRKNEMKKLDNGGEEISGILKNIGENKTDAVLVANFYDYLGESIGISVLPFKGLVPDSLQRFKLTYYPPEGGKIGSHILDIAEMADGNITEFDSMSSELPLESI
jgi:hypothetical protein